MGRSHLSFQGIHATRGAAARKSVALRLILKGLLFVVRSRCLPDFHQTAIKVLLDLQSTNANLSNPDVISLADELRHVPRNLHDDESLSNLAMCVLDGH